MSRSTLASREVSPKSVSLTRSACVLMSAKMLTFILSLAVPLLLARRLSQADFGLYKQVFLLVNTATTVLPLGFAMSAFYFLPRAREREGPVVFNVLLFHLFVGLLAGGTLIVRPTVLTTIFNSDALVPDAALLGAVLVLWVAASCFDIVAIADGETALAAAMIITVSATRAALLIAAVVLVGSIRALLYAALVQGILQVLIMLLYFQSRFTGFWRVLDWSIMRSQFAYAVPLGAAGFLYWLQMDLHHYFVANRFGAAEYAVYAVGCFQLPFVAILSESVGSIMIARVNRLHVESKREEILMLTTRIMRKLAAVYLPLYAFLLVAGRELIAVLFTAQYRDSWPIFAINLTLIPLSIISTAYDPIVRADVSRISFVLRVRVVSAGTLVIGLWFTTQFFDPAAVILLVVAVNLVERLSIAFKVGVALGIAGRQWAVLKGIARCAGAASIAGGVAMVSRSLLPGADPAVVLIVSGVMFGLAYLVGAVVLDVLEPAELNAIRWKAALFLRGCWAFRREEAVESIHKR